MLSILVPSVIIVACSPASEIRDPFDAIANNQQPSEPIDPFFSFKENPVETTRTDEDGVFKAVASKKTNKLPLQKRKQRLVSDQLADLLREFKFSQPGVAPKLTGSTTDWSSPISFEYFHFGENDGTVVNPSATYLNGGEFEKIATPKCHFIGCGGPFPNDGTLPVDSPPQKDKVCHRTFVPLNGCTNNKGYPMGMLCSICCECSAAFVNEMKKTHGFQIGYNA
uniref:Secreted protein n=1 Tax=Angiostrongylus cantonensis TaxID=6313 RepID=A0A0K0CST1_ANGCA